LRHGIVTIPAHFFKYVVWYKKAVIASGKRKIREKEFVTTELLLFDNQISWLRQKFRFVLSLKLEFCALEEIYVFAMNRTTRLQRASKWLPQLLKQLLLVLFDFLCCRKRFTC